VAQVYEERGLLYRVRILDDGVEAYFFPYRYMIPRAEIEDVRIVERIPWYVGWGLRIVPFGKIYFVPHHGRYVEIRVRNRCWRSVVLYVRNVERFLSYLRSMLGAAGSIDASSGGGPRGAS
jgi:hypothetical protein